MSRPDSATSVLFGRHRSPLTWPVRLLSGLVLFAAFPGLWFAGLLADLVGAPLDFAEGDAFSGFLYVIYGALVLRGMRDWWLRSRQGSQPALEGAPA